MSPPAQKKTVPNSAYELAIALTMLEGGRFAAILPGECVAYLRKRPETYSVPPTSPNSLELALDTNKRISNWVKKSILYCEDLEERIARMRFMCNTAAVSLPCPDHSKQRLTLGIGMPDFAQLFVHVGHLECFAIARPHAVVTHAERAERL